MDCKALAANDQCARGQPSLEVTSAGRTFGSRCKRDLASSDIKAKDGC